MIYRILRFLIILALSSKTNLSFSQKPFSDTVVSSASTQYSASFLGRLIAGSNYRREWGTLVAMPVFYLRESGLTIKELGGGMQTKSLRLLDKKNREWVLRSVDKDAEGALPKQFRFPIAVNFVQDQVSAAHPYAPLVVDYLAEATSIIAPKPKLFFVGDDETFGEYRKLFANTVCFLEQREPTPDNSETESTLKVMEEIIEENDHLVLQEMVLRARLLDMLIGDWDRHADQWRWGTVNRGAEKYYYAIPRDRDQAFFWTKGLLPKLIKVFAVKHINGFKKESRNLKALNFKSWGFDKTFVNELDASIWERVTKDFQAKLTDDVIEAAVKKLPKEIYPISGPLLQEKLKGRRDTFLDGVLKYYKFISATVDISGTDEEELFEIKGHEKHLIVSVFRMKDNKKGKKIYERIFDQEDTRFINLQGLGGSDQFFVEENTSSKIRIRINGGKGEDLYDLRGKLRTTVADTLSDSNKIINNSGGAKIPFYKG